MKLHLEIFYSTLRRETFYFEKINTDITSSKEDPSTLAKEYILGNKFNQVKLTDSRKYILHSTSWRYQSDGSIVLTYFIFSDRMSFKDKNIKHINYTKAFMPQKKYKSERTNPRPNRIFKLDVFLHGLRHIAFLVNKDTKGTYRRILDNSSLKIFQKIHPQLAGQI